MDVLVFNDGSGFSKTSTYQNQMYRDCKKKMNSSAQLEFTQLTVELLKSKVIIIINHFTITN